MTRYAGWRRRVPLLVLVAASVTGVLLVATAGSEGTLTYYRTPTELVVAPSDDQVRLGGLVVADSIRRDDDRLRFRLTDGDHEIEVVSDDVPPKTFRVGQGAVVEGSLDDRGVFRAESIVVRHDNQYQPAKMLEQ
jgi:cytochrome c-type biogenesis protein CcmE